MTLYWWNHWFWITVVSVLATLPFTSVATYPISSPTLEQIEDSKNNNQNNNKNSKLPLEFPLPAQTDVEDIFTGSENIPRTLLIKEEIIDKINNGKDEIKTATSSSLSASLSVQVKSKIENQLSDRTVKDVDQSIEHQKDSTNYDAIIKLEKKNGNGNITNSNNNNNNNNSSDPNSGNSKSVIQLIPKAINHDKEKELDSQVSESEMSSSLSSPAILNNMKKQMESLDVVSFDNSNNNNTNNSNVSNISTNISLGEKSHEQLKIATTLSPLISKTTEINQKSVSNIMQVTKSSSKIRSKTSITTSDDSNDSGSLNNNFASNENISIINSHLDDTTIGSDIISMTTILHPVDENYNSNSDIKISDTDDNYNSHLIKSENRSDEMNGKIPVTLENVTKLTDKNLSKDSERFRKSKGLSSEYRDTFINNYSSDAKNLLTRSAGQEEDFNERSRTDDGGGNVSSEALQVKQAYVMDAGTISGICLSVLAVCCGVGTVGIVLYRRRFLNKPQALSEPDSSVYIDDSTIRDNSDEMYSLDNDSFLNSLEAMTIQNYWTDTVKHTKL